MPEILPNVSGRITGASLGNQGRCLHLQRLSVSAVLAIPHLSPPGTIKLKTGAPVALFPSSLFLHPLRHDLETALGDNCHLSRAVYSRPQFSWSMGPDCDPGSMRGRLPMGAFLVSAPAGAVFVCFRGRSPADCMHGSCRMRILLGKIRVLSVPSWTRHVVALVSATSQLDHRGIPLLTWALLFRFLHHSGTEQYPKLRSSSSGQHF